MVIRAKITHYSISFMWIASNTSGRVNRSPSSACVIIKGTYIARLCCDTVCVSTQQPDASDDLPAIPIMEIISNQFFTDTLRNMQPSGDLPITSYNKFDTFVEFSVSHFLSIFHLCLYS